MRGNPALDRKRLILESEWASRSDLGTSGCFQLEVPLVEEHMAHWAALMREAFASEFSERERWR